MAYIVGIVLALAVLLFARWSGFDRDRAFYPTVVIVVASYYVLFAATAGSASAIVIETALMALFTAVAVLAFKRYPFLVVVGLAAHGVLDAVHGRLVENAGVPQAWPAFCLAFDVGAAALLGLRHVCDRAARLASAQSGPR
jgi:hypothetical protein